jgi:chromatin assembly factor 1 subunit B
MVCTLPRKHHCVVHLAPGKCVCEIAEHTHFVQGVAWDPLNEYIATQSSDRSMHIYHISTKNGVFEAHAVGRNTRMAHRHSRTPSVSNHNGSRTRHGSSPRPPMLRWESNSAISDAESDRDADVFGSAAPLTPTTSVASTPSTAAGAFMFPPPSVVPSANNSSAPASVVGNDPSSRRSSFSGSNAPSSPQVVNPYGRYGRSPSPMPPLPAIRTPVTPPISNVRLYGDESYTNFFRRLTFSPDGGLLLTPAGQFEDPSVIVPPHPADVETTTPSRGRKGRQPSVGTQQGAAQSQSGSNSCVYIYSRANFARPPIAQLPGHKKASVAVRFSPVLYELRSGVVGPASATGEHETKTHAPESAKVGVIDKGVEGSIDVDIAGPTIPSGTSVTASPVVGQRSPQKRRASSQTPILEPAPRQHSHGGSIMVSPSLPATDAKPPTPAASKPPTPAPSTAGIGSHTASTGSVFGLPYRMLFAVVTMDTLTIYDTQQSSPFCLLTKLHYDEFTDVSW